MSKTKWENVNDAIFAIAKRAKELTDMSMDELRLLCSDSAEGSTHAARSEFSGCTKGELVETVLTNEFYEEFPAELQPYGTE